MAVPDTCQNPGKEKGDLCDGTTMGVCNPGNENGVCSHLAKGPGYGPEMDRLRGGYGDSQRDFRVFCQAIPGQKI